MFTRILIGLILVAVGALMVIKTNKFQDFFGEMAWTYKYLGSGGTRLMYKFIGLLMCFVGFMVMTNLWTAFLNATLGSWLIR
ncbi:MAG: hypothetical protein P1P90_03080 [Patescibacteria group bacterium]|nr:hypothetical protein [Patescibacteria group bacterium]